MSKEIVCRALGHHYVDRGRSVEVLTPTDLVIEKGSFVSIVGPSGCGKTTLMNVVAGLVAPTEGQVLVGGRPITGPGPDRGVIFQEFALMPWKSVLANVEFALRMRGVPARERRALALKQLSFVGLSGYEDFYPHQLSGGMKQRTAIARAYAMEPEVLLMDEPFGALDAQTRSILQDDLLRTWNARGQTVVFITHDIDEAFDLSSRVLVMSKRPGRILADIAVPFDYPRTPDIRFTDAFTELKSQAWQLIQSQHVRHLSEH